MTDRFLGRGGERRGEERREITKNREYLGDLICTILM